jgi:hypothetical protein
VAVGLFAFVVYIRHRASLPAPPTPIPTPPPTPNIAKQPYSFKSNAECFACHKDIADECAQDEHSKAWFNKPLMPQDPKRTECVSCHASLPILELGLDKMPLVRNARYEEGIGCIECHQLNDTVHGPLPAVQAACNPVQNKIFTDSMACAPCHAPHGTMDEWKASEWGKKGVTCQACHMPEVERPSADGGPKRKVRSHKMLTQRDPEFLKKAVSVKASIEGGKLVVSITNDNTGHKFPGEIFNREVFLKTEIYNEQAERVANFRESMKTPPRPQRGSEPTTQIQAGETRTYTYDLPAGKLKITMFLGYKLFIFNPDQTALEVWKGELER